jgi:hypothetical protein
MLASCCAIGRSSVEATKACLIRAVRAALAARLALRARLAGFRLLAAADLPLLAVAWASLVAESSALLALLARLTCLRLLAVGLFADVLARLDFLAVLPAAVFPFATAVLPLLAEAWGCIAAGSSEVCPATGGTAIRIESRRAMDRPTIGNGEDGALISPLYA